jgi:hypothetical protein
LAHTIVITSATPNAIRFELIRRGRSCSGGYNLRTLKFPRNDHEARIAADDLDQLLNDARRSRHL